MPKKVEGWKKGEGPYSNSDDLNLKQEPVPPFSLGRDISRNVDSNGDRTDGFAAKLTPTKGE